MRRLAWLWSVVWLVPAVSFGQAAAGRTGTPPPTGSARAVPAPSDALPVRRVVLYKNGVGYFEHLGEVHGSQATTISFTSEQLNDALKSLTTLDLGGGRISSITYNSDTPLAQRLGAIGLPAGAAATLGEFFRSIRGARVEAQTASGVIRGRVLGVEKRRRAQRTGEIAEVEEISILGEAGEVRLVELSPASNVRLADRALREQMQRYLGTLGSSLEQTLRRMTVTTAGTGARQLFVSYVSEVPVWKTTYRLVVPSKTGAKPLLQGWAIVDNTTGEDWTNVQMSLVAGAPQSFIQQISQPYYLRRPVVPLPGNAQLTPQTHEGAVSGGAASVSGQVTDSNGAALPGVAVRVRGNGGLVAEAVTDAEGRYQLSLAPGRYRLGFELAGFRGVQSALNLVAGEAAEEDATLSVGGLAEAVMVDAAPSRAMAPPPPAPFASGAAVADARAKLEVSASGQALGDLFEYRITEPVTIRQNQSALVPILNAELAVEKVTIWNPSQHEGVPLRGVWLENSSGLTLDAGSFTVIESEAFAGEGLMAALRPGEKRLLSFAADTAVRVDSKSEGGPRTVERVRIDKGTMTRSLQERQRRTYTVRNEDDAPRTVILEHPVGAGWRLSAETPAPAESSGNWHRFRLTVAPRATASLTVAESRIGMESIFISATPMAEMALWMEGPEADPSLRAALQPVLQQKQAIAAADRALEARNGEMAQIAEDQRRLRENLAALKGSAEEKALVQRYVRRLDEQETRLETVRREKVALEQQRAAAQAELERLIASLALDVTR